MTKEKCPECGNAKVYYASRLRDRFERAISGSRRRFCPKCSCRWAVKGEPRLQRLRIAALAASILTFAAVGSYIVASTPMGRDARLPWVSYTAWRAGLRRGPLSGPGGKAAAANDPIAAALVAYGSGRSYAPGEDPADPVHGGFPAQRGMPSLSDLLKAFFQRGGTKQQLDDLAHMDKKALWEKYGSYFQSKEQAKSYYNQYLQMKGDKSASSLIPEAPPPSKAN